MRENSRVVPARGRRLSSRPQRQSSLVKAQASLKHNIPIEGDRTNGSKTRLAFVVAPSNDQFRK
jgi:hypothetical protein